MQIKFAIILCIITLLTLLLFIKNSRKRLWQQNNTRNSRMFTWRSVIVIGIIVVFLVFSLFYQLNL